MKEALGVWGWLLCVPYPNSWVVIGRPLFKGTLLDPTSGSLNRDLAEINYTPRVSLILPPIKKGSFSAASVTCKISRATVWLSLQAGDTPGNQGAAGLRLLYLKPRAEATLGLGFFSA